MHNNEEGGDEGENIENDELLKEKEDIIEIDTAKVKKELKIKVFQYEKYFGVMKDQIYYYYGI